MKNGEIVTDKGKIKNILETARNVAIIGLSSNAEKESNEVGGYLQSKGYRIFPIHPKEDEILGRKVYRSLDELTESLEEPVDVVDVFRRPEQMLPHAEEAIRHKPRVFWMQLGIENREAAEMLADAGIDVVMNHCMKQEHEKLF
jgi:uncharacterized protein